MHEALCSHYIRYIDCGPSVLRPDGFWTSDDLGHQRQLFMSPTIFREMIKPYYARWVRAYVAITCTGGSTHAATTPQSWMI